MESYLGFFGVVCFSVFLFSHFFFIFSFDNTREHQTTIQSVS